MAYAATALPSLLSSLIFCDPVLPAPELDRSVVGLTMGALVRREKWASREEAWEGFLSKAFFRSWDERVLGLYVACGVKDVEQKKEAGKKEVALKTRAKDEAVSAARRLPLFDSVLADILSAHLSSSLAIPWPSQPVAPALVSPPSLRHSQSTSFSPTKVVQSSPRNLSRPCSVEYPMPPSQEFRERGIWSRRRHQRRREELLRSSSSRLIQRRSLLDCKG